MKKMLAKFLVCSCVVVMLSATTVYSSIDEWPKGFPVPGEKVDQNGMPMESMMVGTLLNSDIKNINLDFTLPENHKLLTEAKPFVRLFTKRGEVFTSDITSPKQVISVNKHVDSDTLYAEVGLFYCRQGEQGICLIKKLLYVYGIRNHSEFHDLRLRYTVQEDY